jgi:putative peptidoglycan lipid II flippase
MMLRRLGTIGGFTLLSRIFGFGRDMLMASALGAGPVADAFMLAFRLPNHFRSIVAEGAFNSAFTPLHSTLEVRDGSTAAENFRSEILVLLLVVNALVLLFAIGATGALLAVLAPGLVRDGPTYALTHDLTRITFPYLMCMSVVALLSGVLNTRGRFAASAAAPILLNVAMIACLVLAGHFASAAYAAAWGVMIGGIAQLLLLMIATYRAGISFRIKRPELTSDVLLFFRRLGPAILTAGVVQIAMFADTIIATFLPAGALSHLYYADRLYQLPIGVIGVALGTALLPEIGRGTGSGDESSMRRATDSAMQICLVVGVPITVLMASTGDWAIELLFGRGRFDASAVAGAANVLVAYSIGVPAALMIRLLVAGFHGRGDMRTPLRALTFATLLNVILKFALSGWIGAAGLALATSAGVWLYTATLYRQSVKRAHVSRAGKVRILVFCAAALAMYVTVWKAMPLASTLVWTSIETLDDAIGLGLLAICSLAVYSLVLYFGRAWTKPR